LTNKRSKKAGFDVKSAEMAARVVGEWLAWMLGLHTTRVRNLNHKS